jgi:Icc-related predicted phosphoesterase
LKILFLSDLHGYKDALKQLRKIAPEYDLIINSGDIGGKHFLENEKDLSEYQLDDFKLYLDTLKKVPHYYILGNDDWFEVNEEHRLTKVVEFNGIYLVPFEYVPSSRYNSNRELGDDEIESMLQKLDPPKPFIFVSHAPPYGILDKNYRGKNSGSKAIRNFVLKHKPLIHCFGHIHESFGDEYYENILFLNSSMDSCLGHFVEIDGNNKITKWDCI